MAAEIKIRLIYNVETGKKDIFIDYESEDDALPIEHEQDHRSIVEQLLGKGILAEEEVGNVRVERVRPGEIQGDQKNETPLHETGEEQEGA